MKSSEKAYAADAKRDVKEDSPPPYLDATGSVTYSVDYAAWKRNVFILDPTGQPLFTSHNGGTCSTRLEITNNQSQVIGSTKRSSMTSKIEVQLTNPSQSFEIHNSGSIFGGSPGYLSPSFNGQKVIWKNKARSRAIIYTLEDDRGIDIARFESNPRTEIGKLELTHEAVRADRMNEIVVTLLTLLHRKLKNIEINKTVVVT